MASFSEVKYFNDWHCDDTGSEEAEIETEGNEEAGRLTRSEAWFSCGKLQNDPYYHQRYIPLKLALGFSDLSREEKEKVVKTLTDEDIQFLESEKARKCLERLADAVVCVKIKSSYGTGFFIRITDEFKESGDGDVVITNSHTLRKLASAQGSDFSVVEPRDIRVISFYDGTERGSQVSRDVVRIGRLSPPDKNKDKDITLRRVKAALYGDGTAVTETTAKIISIFDQLAPVLSATEGFLDYALLFLKPLDNKEQKRKFENHVTPLEVKVFKPRFPADQYRNRAYFEIPVPESSTLPRSLRLFTISHPHRASKQVSFGGIESTLQHVYLLNQLAGQNDTDLLEGKDSFLEHSIATCPGSSGAPVFMYFVNHEKKEVEIDEAVYFLHFFGIESGQKLLGKAVSFGTIFYQLTFE